MELKDIAVIEPETGIVLNVVRDISPERAATFFPGLTCVERKPDEMHEPGAKVAVDGKVTKRASEVTEAEKKLAETKAEAAKEVALALEAAFIQEGK